MRQQTANSGLCGQIDFLLAKSAIILIAKYRKSSEKRVDR